MEYCKVVISQIEVQIQYNHYENSSSCFLWQIDRLILKFTWKVQNVAKNPEENRVEELTIRLQNYYKTTVIKIVQYWQKAGQNENPETDT